MTDWRDSYDSWKLATPPEYEEEPSEESLLEEGCWRDGLSREETAAVMALYHREKLAEKARARHARRHAPKRRRAALFAVDVDDFVPF